MRNSRCARSFQNGSALVTCRDHTSQKLRRFRRATSAREDAWYREVWKSGGYATTLLVRPSRRRPRETEDLLHSRVGRQVQCRHPHPHRHPRRQAKKAPASARKLLLASLAWTLSRAASPCSCSSWDSRLSRCVKLFRKLVLSSDSSWSVCATTMPRKKTPHRYTARFAF